ncbi:hypothetical protein Golax_015542, partial [Gossypium laxum]|nr:hypothetical protein [Gossypium laxum]
MCDENGDWVFGYNRFIRKCSVFYAELWSILDGLKLIQQEVMIREHNLSSDYLAKLDFATKEDLQLVDTPPRKVLEFLEADKEK